MNNKKKVIDYCLQVMGKGNGYMYKHNLNEIHDCILSSTNTEILTSKDYMEYITNKELEKRLHFGVLLDKIEENNKDALPIYQEIKDNEPYVAKLSSNITKFNTFELNQTIRNGIRNHDVVLYKLKNKLYFFKLTSTPTSYEPFINLGTPNLCGQGLNQYVSKNLHSVNTLHTSNITIISKPNQEHIFNQMEISGCFKEMMYYNNQFNSIVVDESRLNRVRKNIALFFKEQIDE